MYLHELLECSNKPIENTAAQSNSHKRPPKTQTLSGRLREVVVYKNRTTQEVSSKNWSRHIYFTEDNLLHAMSKLGFV